MLFTKKSEPDTALGDIEQGGLSLFSKLRLREHAQHPETCFTSTFSVPELLLTRSTGFVPMAQVGGSSVYHIGWQFTPGVFSGELAVMSAAYEDAWGRALSRVRQQACMIGAHGVVGLKSERRAVEGSLTDEGDTGDIRNRRIIEIAITGTAVRYPGAAATEDPFLCPLSAEEFWALGASGSYPVSYVFGASVYRHATLWAAGTNPYLWQSREITEFQQAFSAARHRAHSRLLDRALGGGSHGVLGITTDYTTHTQELEYDDQWTETKRRGLAATVFVFMSGAAIVERWPERDPVAEYALDLTHDGRQHIPNQTRA